LMVGVPFHEHRGFRAKNKPTLSTGVLPIDRILWAPTQIPLCGLCAMLSR
jgi:hypothetical protein